MRKFIFLSIASGILTALSFPKFNLSILIWFSIAFLLYAIERSKDPNEAALLGFIFGLSFFLINLSWITTLSNFASCWAYIGWILLSVFESAFILVFALTAKYFISKRYLSLSIPFLWVFVEYLRSLGIFGVTAGVLGYSQSSALPLIQFAEFTTVYGVSFVIVLFNLGIAKFLSERKKGIIVFALLLIAVLFLYGEARISQLDKDASENEITVALIQGNVPQKEKMNYFNTQKIFDLHKDLSLKTKNKKPDIIIWSETIAVDYLANKEKYFEEIKGLARELNALLLIGTPYYEGGNIYNSIVAVSQDGIISRYDKQRLVAFGEYLPMRQLTYPILKHTGFFDNEYSFGGKKSNLKLKNVKIAAAICFESTFVDILKSYVKDDTDIMLTVTNDAWFFDSSALDKHLNNGIFRAIENRRYFIQVGNTGKTAVINKWGKVVKSCPANETCILTYKIPLR
jgi:apolipoprotein N-acyltransferase